jgi:glutamate-1-semialdehyde 2,1-aminomutase
LFFQELIKYGILYRGTFNISPSHSEEDIQQTVDAFSMAMKVYKKALESGYEKYLVGEPIKPVFRKWN